MIDHFELLTIDFSNHSRADVCFDGGCPLKPTALYTYLLGKLKVDEKALYVFKEAFIHAESYKNIFVEIVPGQVPNGILYTSEIVQVVGEKRVFSHCLNTGETYFLRFYND